ncbi:MAG: AMP-binding protein [Clostridiales bacterium]|nr:AMP-binding protein [Clostridiales bacterium]
MPIYEKFIGMHRDDCKSLKELTEKFEIKHAENFNFAYDVLDELGKTVPDKLCMLWVGNDGEEKRISFSEMMIYSNKTANYFKSLGIKKGDFVLLVLKRSYLFWYAMMALHKIGAIAVQATHLLQVKDYVYRCNAAGLKMAVITGDGDCTELFDQGLEEYKTVELKAVTKGKNAGKGWHDFEAGIENASEEWSRPTGSEDTAASDTMLVSFSSGTTGYPKMVRHDYTYPLGHLMTGVFWHRVIDGGLHFTISDTGWLKSLWGKMYGQWLGESAVFTYDFEKFSGADILSKLEKYKITTFCAPPTMYRFMVIEDVPSYNLCALKHCCTAGEALNQDIFVKWKEFTGLNIYEGFGQTETTLCCGTLYPFSEAVPGAMGLPIPGYDIVVADEDGKEVPVGVSGEICIRLGKPIKGLYKEYYRDSEATANSFRGGIFHTGDIVYRDEQGYMWYVGRNDDIIKSSGYRIGPFEVESVLSEHPAVMEAAVTGVPDPVRGFNVKASIVLKKGFAPSTMLVKEIQDFVKKNTAPYKYPRVVEFVDELPKTISGKIRRVELRK